jgi:hypothetical protein
MYSVSEVMMEKLEIEVGVVPPEPRRMFKYPHADMVVGDSFQVPVAHKVNVLNANSRATRKLGWVFMSRTEGEYVRVWRIR